MSKADLLHQVPGGYRVQVNWLSQAPQSIVTHQEFNSR